MRKIFIPLLLLMFPLLIFAQDPMQEGISLIEKGELEKAMVKFDEAKKLDPQNPAPWVLTANVKFAIGELVNGLADLDSAIALDPQFSDAYYSRALMYNNYMQKRNSALKDLNKAIGLAPDSSKYYLLRGVFSLEVNDLEGAEKDFTTAEQKGDHSAEVYAYHAAALAGQEKYKAALPYTQKAINADSLNLMGWAVKMQIHIMDVNPAAICKTIEEANRIKLESEVVKALEAQGFCKLSLAGQYGDLGETFFSQGGLEKALFAYEEGLKLEPDNQELLLGHGNAAFYMGKTAEAKKDYEKVLGQMDASQKGEKMELLQALADMTAIEEEYQASIAFDNQLLELDPENAVALLSRGYCYRKLKEFDKAAADIEKVMKNDPENHLAYVYRAWNYLDQEKFDLALKDAEKAIEMKDTDGLCYMILGEVKRKMGRDDYCFDYQMAKTLDILEARDLLEEHCK